MERGARWIFADQLGPHFLDDAVEDGSDGADGPVIIIEAESALRRRRYHRAKAHLIISALRHRVAELGDRAVYVRAPGYRSGLAQAIDRLGITPGEVTVCDPTSHRARQFVRELGVNVIPARGFVTSEADFAAWVESRGAKRLLLEDFYRTTRRRTGVLMEDTEPVGDRWNLDADNREPPPKGQSDLGLPEPYWPAEDAIDAQVRLDLDKLEDDGAATFVGTDGPRRFAATRAEALAVLEDFVAHRLAPFGPYEDATMADDWVMAHSLLSAPMNLGLIDPMEAITAVETAWSEGAAPLASVEGFIRQVMGWRDYVWHLYWHLGENYVRDSNALQAQQPLPAWWRDLGHSEITARCLSATMHDIDRRGWVHHIPRLMILGNWALQQGYDPVETTEWFTEVFVDAYPWVMAANVVGMALYADGGTMATKPYAAGGAYISRMTNYCRPCAYRPGDRTGERACPFTAGYWAFLDSHRETFRGNHRLAQPLRGLDRLGDLPEAIEGVRRRGADPP